MLRTRALVSAAVSAALGAALLALPTAVATSAYAENGTPGPTPTVTAPPTTAPPTTAPPAPDPSDPPTTAPTDAPTTPVPTPSETGAPGNGSAPVIGAVHSAPGDGGLLDVAAASDSPITAITARLSPVDASGDAGRANVTDFTLLSGTATDGVWRSARLSALTGYGTYSVSLSVRDADGDVTDVTDAASILFDRRPVFSNRSITPGTLDAAHPKITAQGTISLFDPATGLTSPLVGQSVSFHAADIDLTTTTDAAGHYTFTGTPDPYRFGGGVAVEVSFWFRRGNGTEDLTTVDGATLLATSSPTRIRLDHTSVKINYGTKVSVSGVVEYQSAGAWHPAPAGVGLVMSYYGTAKTDAKGRFTISYPYLPSDDGNWLVETQNYGTNPYLTYAKSAFKVDVVNKTYLCLCTSWLNEYSELHIEGSLTSSNGKLPASKKIYVQQSANGKSGWKTLGWFNANSKGNFKLDGGVATPKGYWRLYYPAQTDYLAGYSNSVHFSRTDTRITGFNASPEPVRKGRTITTVGTLSRLSAAKGTKWATWSKQRVYIYFLPKGKKSYTYMGSAVTNSKGHFTHKFTAKKDGTWTAVWFTPNGSYVDAESAGDYVDVR
ncbi:MULTISPECIES: hypothetical protein [unclassified Streptomyces]|uniref:hypothetical protein n=1 Tax=unclassified Streptomyces TaxID=2593676 RepID=UPI002E2E23C8|nr:hypothetical protein [Streptomyces sp. NBC_00223]